LGGRSSLIRLEAYGGGYSCTVQPQEGDIQYISGLGMKAEMLDFDLLIHFSIDNKSNQWLEQ